MAQDGCSTHLCSRRCANETTETMESEVQQQPKRWLERGVVDVVSELHVSRIVRNGDSDSIQAREEISKRTQQTRVINLLR